MPTSYSRIPPLKHTLHIPLVPLKIDHQKRLVPPRIRLRTTVASTRSILSPSVLLTPERPHSSWIAGPDSCLERTEGGRRERGVDAFIRRIAREGV